MDRQWLVADELDSQFSKKKANIWTKYLKYENLTDVSLLKLFYFLLHYPLFGYPNFEKQPNTTFKNSKW